ncbi:MAG: helix-turn-helix transcriptional regulator [Lachnospiraceae bacterium]|nr:helix-turn-helix transcriptional regulator [Lachnospiraceae bacterium]
MKEKIHMEPPIRDLSGSPHSEMKTASGYVLSKKLRTSCYNLMVSLPFGSFFTKESAMSTRNPSQPFARNFSDYLMAVRLENAKKLLLETEAGMELVAQQSGFSSSYFIHIFRETLGMTPGQYRKEFWV